MSALTDQEEKIVKAARLRRLKIIKEARGIKPSDGYRLHYMGLYWLPDERTYYVYEVTNINQRDWITGLRHFALVDCETEAYRPATNEEMFGFMYREHPKVNIEEGIIEMSNKYTTIQKGIGYERKDGPTPRGGDYSEAFYFDENGRPCPKEEASYVDIHEYTNDGRLIGTVHGICAKD